LFNCNILGLGYIGLPTAAILCSAGHKINGVDINKNLVKDLRNGLIHISEPDLHDLVKDSLKSNKLIISNKPISADIHFITVPTPLLNLDQKSLKADLSNVINAAKAIANILKKNDLIILESTCPVGTTIKISEIVSKESGISREDFHIVYCPERVLPGNIINEIKSNNRVIGADSEKAKELAVNFFSSFSNGALMTTDSKTAELIKLSENAYRDLNIAFANELSMICDQFNINTQQLINIANQHPRVNILKPGIGVGGHCIAVDPWFIISELPEQTELIKKARQVNLKKTHWVLSKIKKTIRNFENRNKNKKVFTYGFFGITFKPDVDDTRESPALWIINQLIASKINLLVYDPNVSQSKIDIKISPYEEVLEKSDLNFILVGHKEFKYSNKINENIIDICNLIKDD
tara:strand:+ start:2287 stop:3510 length:1224 start_codon:yes stop_codon:yes gene_type:complete